MEEIQRERLLLALEHELIVKFLTETADGDTESA